MKLSTILLIGTAFVLLTGCVPNPYVAPQGEPAATVHNYRQGGAGLSNFENATITQIDGKNIASSYDTGIPVRSGTHNFVIDTAYTHGFFDAIKEAYSEVNATLAAGHEYYVHETSENDHVKVWIADQNGRTVSTVASDPARPEQTYTPVFMPVTFKK